MNTILAALFLVAFLAFWLWVFWGPISMIYHIIMLAACAVILVAMTIYDGVISAYEAIRRMVSK